MTSGIPMISPAPVDPPEFPESVLRPRRARWRARGRAAVVGVTLVGVVAGGVLVARRVAAADPQPDRTATVATQSIDEVYRAVAATEPVSRAEVAFPISGEVTSVAVAVGDDVQLGDTLATVDTTDLERALREAESTLASAQLTLNVALSGEDPGSVLGGSQGGAPAMGVSSTGETTYQYASALVAESYSLVAVAPDEVQASRAAVVDAQSTVTSASNTVAALRDSATSICAAVDVTIDPNDPEGSLATISNPLGACRSALDALASGQSDVTAAQDQLTAAADALDSLLTTWAADLDAEAEETPSTTTEPESGATTTTTTTAPSSTPSTTVPDDSDSGNLPDGSMPGDDALPGSDDSAGGGFGGGAPSGGGAIGGSSGGSSASEETAEPTAEELIEYQKAYDAAVAEVEAARQAIAQATIVSPISGTVIAVGVAVGDEVSSGSDTQTVVVQGEGGYEATISVSVDDIDRIELGQAAQLTPDGGGPAQSGEVVAVSLVPDSSGSTASYRVTIGLDGDTSTIRDGNIGDMAIVIDSVADAVAVPTSAVTPSADGYTVEVVGPDGTTETVRVDVGVIGTTWTEITRGLEAGETVVVADVDEPLPDAATDVTDSTGTDGSGGFGGFGGTGSPTGRFPGGGGFQPRGMGG